MKQFKHLSHKGQIKVSFSSFSFFFFVSFLNITRFSYFHVNFMSDFFFNVFSVSLVLSDFFSTNKNTPPTSLNTRITIKSFTKCLHQIFTVYWREQGRMLCGDTSARILWLRHLRSWRRCCCCWWYGRWRCIRRARTCCSIGHVEGHSHFWLNFYFLIYTFIKTLIYLNSILISLLSVFLSIRCLISLVITFGLWSIKKSLSQSRTQLNAKPFASAILNAHSSKSLQL